MSSTTALAHVDEHASGAELGAVGRVLLVARGYPPHGRWGSEFYTRELARGWAARGLEVDVVCPLVGAAAGQRSEHCASDGVRVTALARAAGRRKAFVESYRDEAFEAAFEQELERRRPDVVHFTHLCWSLSMRLPEIVRAHGISSVMTLTDFGLVCHRGQLIDHAGAACSGADAATCARCVREPGRFELRPSTARLKRGIAHGLAALGGFGFVATERDLAQRAVAVERAVGALDRLVAPTHALSRELVARGLPRNKIASLVYSLDERPYRVARAVPTDSTVRIGFLSQFAPHKGAGTLLEAARRLHQRGWTSGYTIDLYGLGEVGRHRRYRQAMLAPELGSTVRVRTPFDADQAPSVLAGLSAVVLPSEWCENAPLAALQARAAGVPIVASDVPGLSEIVSAECGAALFPAGDADALADRLAALIAAGPTRVAHGLPVAMPEHLERLAGLYADLTSPAAQRTVCSAG